MNMQAAPDYFELRDYTGVLRRRWKSVATFAVLGVALAAAYVVLGPKTYTATVEVQVNALPNNANAVGGRTGGPVNMDNEALAVQSAAVATIVQTDLQSSLSLAAISKNISVAVPPNTTFLRISCAAPSAAGAKKCANVVGRAYLSNRRLSIMAVLNTGIKAQRKQATKLGGTIVTLKATLFTTRHKKGVVVSGSRSIEQDTLRLAETQSELAAINSNINSVAPLAASMATPNNTVVGAIVTPATLPTAPSSPRKLLYLPSGLILGLVVGIGMAFLAERRDKRVHSVRDVEHYSGQPTLIRITDRRARQPSTAESPRTATGRAYTELAQVVDAALGEGAHVLAVAATSPGTSASVVAANLAAALARTTDETVLVCGDMQGSRAPELLGAVRGPGLAEILIGAATASGVLAAAGDQPRLRIIPPGLDVARAAGVIQQSAMRDVISDLLATVRYVIIEVQSVGENSDTFALAHFAEAAIITVEVERSRPDDIADCARRLDRLGARVLGTAIVPAGTLVPATRQAKRAEPAQQDRSVVGSVQRYELAPDQGSPAREPQKPPIWTPGTPAAVAPDDPQKFIAESPRAPRWLAGVPATPATPRKPAGREPETGTNEKLTMPRFTPHEREGYSNPADPATGD
jgi:capsular polysaccharide biosynthesis protein/Mrp family chromosome partitioning ATPase